MLLSLLFVFASFLWQAVFDEGYEEAGIMLYEIGVLEQQEAGRGGGAREEGEAEEEEEEEERRGGDGESLELDWPRWPMKRQGRALALELHNLPMRIAL